MRASGILMHISSLPSDYGIGTIGSEAYKFIDFLHSSNQHYWQILPVCPTSYGDSPYQSFSTNAGNPYFIDFEMLTQDGLLVKSDYDSLPWGDSPHRIDYAAMFENRLTVLKKAYERFNSTDKTDFYTFLEKNEKWISNYALFMSIKDAHGGKAWLDWEEPLKFRDSHSLWLFKESHREEVEFYEFIQYIFFRQWNKLKKYAAEKNIKIIGDIPIYVALDSADAWVSPDLFELDDKLTPTLVAGCPPDAFSEDGQLWGNPVYKWQRHRETGYSWWIDRMKSASELYDIIRIDHFRGFDEFYAIPFGDKNAKNGKWLPGPGTELFQAIEGALGTVDIIAEDLGFLTPSVKKLLKDLGFPGMKVLEFAFDPESESDYLPYKYDKNCVVYTGTHDNAPIRAWAKELTAPEFEFCCKYIGSEKTVDDEFVYKFIKTAHASVADTVIIPIQDYLALDASARMNTPSTSAGNWQWRIPKHACTKELSQKIGEITKFFGRCPK